MISPWPGTFHQAQEVHGQAPFMTSFVFNSFCPNLSSQLPTCRDDDYRRSVPSIVATTTMTPQSYPATGPLHPLSAVVANETLAIATGIDHGGVAHFTLAMMQSKKKTDGLAEIRRSSAGSTGTARSSSLDKVWLPAKTSQLPFRVVRQKLRPRQLQRCWPSKAPSTRCNRGILCHNL